MAGPVDLEGYAASLWRFIGGPVLRTCGLVVIVIYTYGAAELQNTFVGSVPPLSRLTDPKIKEFMDMYGLSAVMPFVSIIVFATVVQVVNSIMFSVSNVLPPRFFTREDVAAQQLVNDSLIRGLTSRLEGVQSPDELNTIVDERLAKLRLDRPDHPDLARIDFLQQRDISVNTWLAILRFYVLAALVVSVVAVYGGHDAGPIVRRLLIAWLSLTALYVLATWIWLRRHAALVRYRYETVYRTVQFKESRTSSAVSKDESPFPRLGDSTVVGNNRV